MEGAANNNVTFIGLIRPGLEPSIYRTRCEHANHYATDAVQIVFDHHLINFFFRHDLAEKLLNWRYATITHSLTQILFR
jgi:hypothetical protein